MLLAVDATSRHVSQFAVTLRLGETNPKLHRNAIESSRAVRTMRAPQGKGETVIRKDANLFARQTRWWAVAVRSQAATLTLLRKAAFPRLQPNDPWLRQGPNGIRV